MVGQLGAQLVEEHAPPGTFLVTWFPGEGNLLNSALALKGFHWR